MDPLVVEEHRQLLKMAKRVRLRLSRQLDRHGKNWDPTPEFMSHFTDLGNLVVRLLNEARQLEKSARVDDLSDAELDAELAWAGIVAKNAFRNPPPDEPVVVVQAPAQTEPEVDPPPPYHEWRLVGVWDGANTIGVIMANTRTGRSRLLAPGDGVLGIRLVSAVGERAEFEFEGKRYELLQKQTLADRRELNQPRG